MALADLLDVAQHKKIGLSEERIAAAIPIMRKYTAFWREYPDLFVDFLIHGQKVLTGELTDEERNGKFKFYSYQRIFLRSITRYQYIYCVFPRAYSKSFLTVLGSIIRCILYPGVHLFVTAGG